MGRPKTAVSVMSDEGKQRNEDQPTLHPHLQLPIASITENQQQPGRAPSPSSPSANAKSSTQLHLRARSSSASRINSCASRTVSRAPPKPSTVEEDLQDEINEEKLNVEATVAETFSEEALMHFLDHAHDAQQPERDAKQSEKRKMQQAQLRIIQRRKQQSKRKFDLVEDMYAKSMERRMKAMERIAADPPADRLIGHHMAQYIPAALLPGQLQQMDIYMQNPNMEKERSPTRPALLSPPKESPDPIVFLTQMNDEDRGIPQRNTEGGPTSEGDVDATNAFGPQTTANNAPVEPRSITPGTFEQWQELGYNVLYVDGNKGPKGKRTTGAPPRKGKKKPTAPSTASAEGSPSPPFAEWDDSRTGSVSSSASRGAVFDELKWMKLAPLGSVCLVQRRLPAEDAAILREQEEQLPYLPGYKLPKDPEREAEEAAREKRKSRPRKMIENARYTWKLEQVKAEQQRNMQ